MNFLVGLCFVVTASAQETTLQSLFSPNAEAPVATYAGTLSSPPVPHFSVRLPGELVGSGSHTEYGGPVIYGDLALLGSAGSSALHAVSRRDGSEVLSYPADGPVQSTAVLVGDRVIFGDKGGTTWCYKLDGTLVWRHTGTAPILTTPTLRDNHVYVADVEDLVVALDLATGEIQWRYERPASLSRSSALGLFAKPEPAVRGAFLYAGFSDGAVVALNAETGDSVWEAQVGEGEYPDLVAGLVAHGGDIYVSGYFAPFAAVETTNESVRWRVEAGSAATPLLNSTLAEPVFYHPSSDGHLRAVVARTGEVLWDWDSGKTGALTEITTTDAGLLFGVADGGIYIVDPETGDEVWRYRGQRQLNGVSVAPTVSGRQVMFVTNAGRLISMLTPTGREQDDRRPWDSRFE
ncbi:MAG: outer membrane protein assembly factor BamB [Myxococcota bacterium]